ncbi:hypothetical protein BSL78_08864 [Apostichopus japonicus]|uniref:Uncharacterized protein n=1 Tax=Stichopus japonicus TaxID=307972 RepID=A0A2G8L1V9_STIJA|nr:hypothetical protein BSL78_08864 [Apostichopus japonicus]
MASTSKQTRQRKRRKRSLAFGTIGQMGHTVQLAPAFEELPDEAPVAVVPEAAGAPPAKRRRGRPTRPAPVVVPPPKRPSTPPPPISTQERKALKERVRQRKATLSALGKVDVQEKMALLVEDEDDRHNCCGDWKWESLTEDIPYINEEGQFSREGEDPRGISGAAQRAVTELHLLFLTKEVLTNLVKQTNLYATQERDKEGDSKERWSPVTREEHYHPGKNLSLDEQMLGTKARCSFIQYMKDKPTKRSEIVGPL